MSLSLSLVEIAKYTSLNFTAQRSVYYPRLFHYLIFPLYIIPRLQFHFVQHVR
jgi:hypothetical protein